MDEWITCEPITIEDMEAVDGDGSLKDMFRRIIQTNDGGLFTGPGLDYLDEEIRKRNIDIRLKHNKEI